MKIAVVTGSFDPISIGHLDIIQRASKMFDKLYVVAFINEKKEYFFTEDERLDMIKIAVKDMDNVSADFSSGFACDYCLKVGAQCMVRGIRDVKDYLYEVDLAKQNLDFKGIDTLFLLANNTVNSKEIREKLVNGESVKGLVPTEVYEYIEKLKIKKNEKEEK